MNSTLVGFEVFTTVTLENTVLWDMTPCSLVEVYRRFGGTYFLYLQSLRVIQATGKNQTESYSEAVGFSERSFDICKTTRRHIPENSTIQYFNCIDTVATVQK
jgi:hypothetical protein